MRSFFLSLFLVICPTISFPEPAARHYVVVDIEQPEVFCQYLGLTTSFESFVFRHATRDSMIVVKRSGEMCAYTPQERDLDSGEDWQERADKDVARFRDWIYSVADTPGDIVMENQTVRRDCILIVCD